MVRLLGGQTSGQATRQTVVSGSDFRGCFADSHELSPRASARAGNPDIDDWTTLELDLSEYLRRTGAKRHGG